LVLRSDGKVLSWGDDTRGQLGDWIASAQPTLTPTVVRINLSALAISAGSYHSLAILNDHTLWSWGDNTYGQLGYSSFDSVLQSDPLFSSVAIKVGVDSDWSAVAGGGTHTLAIKQDQTLWAWGGNAYGQLGNNTTVDAPAPVQIGSTNRWIAVAAGKYHSMAIDTNNKLWTWGRNAEGQLGNGTTVGPVLVPTAIP
jgi:alpha-tubulin suppressor-like RCC1 family protein